jgi:hypothetical protein
LHAEVSHALTRNLAANRKTPISGQVTAIHRPYDFLQKIMSPSGRTLQLGDSYALDARNDLSVVCSRCRPQKTTTVKFFRFPVSPFSAPLNLRLLLMPWMSIAGIFIQPNPTSRFIKDFNRSWRTAVASITICRNTGIIFPLGR